MLHTQTFTSTAPHRFLEADSVHTLGLSRLLCQQQARALLQACMLIRVSQSSKRVVVYARSCGLHGYAGIGQAPATDITVGLVVYSGYPLHTAVSLIDRCLIGRCLMAIMVACWPGAYSCVILQSV